MVAATTLPVMTEVGGDELAETWSNVFCNDIAATASMPVRIAAAPSGSLEECVNIPTIPAAASEANWATSSARTFTGP